MKRDRDDRESEQERLLRQNEELKAKLEMANAKIVRLEEAFARLGVERGETDLSFSGHCRRCGHHSSEHGTVTGQSCRTREQTGPRYAGDDVSYEPCGCTEFK